MERIHLGWNEMPLACAGNWLAERFGERMERVLVALPGARGGRLLGEWLAREVGEGLRPPRIVTAGQLSDELLDIDGVPAGRLVRTLAWERALRELPADSLRRVVARPPLEQDRTRWMQLAEEVRGLFGEIAAEGLDFVKVAASPDLSRRTGELARWTALARAQRGMQRILTEAGRVDPHLARMKAIGEERSRVSEGKIEHVVLVGVVEMNQLLRRALELCPTAQTALAFAPEELADGFDELGCLVPAYWLERGTSLPLERWHVVDRPDDQARKTLEMIGGWDGAFPAERITIGYADSEVVPFLKGRLAEREVVARDAAGTPFARTRPALLLEAVGDFLDRRRYRDFAALVRHPDFESALREQVSNPEIVGGLDDYHNAHLPGNVDGTWLADEHEEKDRRQRGEMVEIWRATEELLGELGSVEKGALAERVEHVRSFVKRVYGREAFEKRREDDRVTIAALRFVGESLAEIEELPETLSSEATATEALGMVQRVNRAASVPPPRPEEGQPTIELLGWLELALDDAPALVVTGFEDGKVPESKRGDAYLPDRLCEKLGLVDDSKRLARDLYATELIVHSREEVAFLSGRRSLSGDPRVPSRIVFHGEPESLVPRVKRFLDGGTGPKRGVTSGIETTRALPRGETWTRPDAMSVTEFKIFLSSPYEYYLRKVLKLESVDDSIRELDGRGFGNLAHAVLYRFGADERIRNERDAGRIATFLSGKLDSLAVELYGRDPLPAVRLQLEQLDYRLATFAKRQAKRRREGWEIQEVEWSPGKGSVPLFVDGEVVRLKGRVDRIDRHPEKGWAIWDYKSTEFLLRPEIAHRTADGRWSDLQLPLYCLLVQELLGEDPPAELGYALLPREPDSIGFYAIPEKWRKKGEFESFDEGLWDAVEAAKEVVRKIRRGEFFTDEGFAPWDPVFAAIGGVGLITGDAEGEGEEE